jgi:ribosome-associated translation inhibitor RaiA
MKLITQHHNLRSTDELNSLVEERILAFGPRLQIDEARVRLECHWEESPAYRVAIYLVTPGPDLQAEGCDHTIRAALGKAVTDLEDKLRERSQKPLRRLQGNLQVHALRRAGRRQS